MKLPLKRTSFHKLNLENSNYLQTGKFRKADNMMIGDD